MTIRRKVLDFLPYFGDTLNLSDLSGCEDADDIGSGCGYFGIINTIRINPELFPYVCRVSGSKDPLPQYTDDATCSAHTGYAEGSSCLATYPDMPAGQIIWNEHFCEEYHKGYWGGLGGLANSEFFTLLDDAQVHLEESVDLYTGNESNIVPVASLSEIANYIRTMGSNGSFYHNDEMVSGKCYDFSEQYLYLYTENEGFISATVRACTDNNTDIVSVKRNGLGGSEHGLLIFAWDLEGSVVASGVVDLPYMQMGTYQSGGITTVKHYEELKGSFFKVGDSVQWYQTCNGNHNNFWNATGSDKLSESFVSGTCENIQNVAWNLE